MRIIKNLNGEERGLIFTAIDSNGGQGVSIFDVKIIENICTKLSLKLNLQKKIVSIADKDCVGEISLTEDEYSYTQRCLKSNMTSWKSFIEAKLAMILFEQLSKLEFKEE